MEARGFLSSLFDLSFTSLITTRIVKVLYVLAMVVTALYAIFLVVAAFTSNVALGVVVLVIGAPLFMLVTLVYTRVLLELFIALFRIMENTNVLVARSGAATGDALASSPIETAPVPPPRPPMAPPA